MNTKTVTAPTAPATIDLAEPDMIDAATLALLNVRADLQRRVIGREREIDALLIGLLARRHVWFVGPPGTGKTMMAECLIDAVPELRSFFISLDETTDPMDVWGPLALTQLQQDKLVRNTAGFAAEANLVVVDEITRSNSALRNTLLGPMQSRVLVNGGVRQALPTIMWVGLSNHEFPEGSEALRDRFTISTIVERLSLADRDRVRVREMDEGTPPAMAFISLAQIGILQALVDGVTIPESVRRDLASLMRTLQHEGLDVSERQDVMSIKPLKASARLHGRNEVTTQDFGILLSTLWTEPKDIPIIKKAIEELHDIGKIANEVVAQFRVVYSRQMARWRAAQDADIAQAQQVGDELWDTFRAVSKEIDKLADEAKRSNQAAKVANALDEIKSMRSEMHRLGVV